MTLLLMMMSLMLAAESPTIGATPVEVTRQDDGHWTLVRGGEVFEVKGVGYGGPADGGRLDELAAIGGNAIRTWGVGRDTHVLLDDAHDNDVAVALGLWIDHKGDPRTDAFRQRHLRKATTAAKRYGNHPALLMWGIGNEGAMYFRGRPEGEAKERAYWTLVNEMSQAIKAIDPHHPTMTISADLGPKAEVPRAFAEVLTDVDVWGINSYGGLASMAERVAAAGYEGPYVMTEYGTIGQWEMPKADFGPPVEMTSTAKADYLAGVYPQQIEAASQCLGGFAFLWGHKQEATQTYFGLILPDGRFTERVDVLQKHWTGEWPEDRAPRIELLEVTGAMGTVRPGDELTATVTASDPDDDELAYRWELRQASGGKANFGRPEASTALMEDEAVMQATGASVTFHAPTEPGPYRLFVFVGADGSDKAATANQLFNVASE